MEKKVSVLDRWSLMHLYNFASTKLLYLHIEIFSLK